MLISCNTVTDRQKTHFINVDKIHLNLNKRLAKSSMALWYLDIILAAWKIVSSFFSRIFIVPNMPIIDFCLSNVSLFQAPELNKMNAYFPNKFS